MDSGLTVVCVYRRGNGFTDEYVYRLREQVAQHCKVPHRFVCLTNHELKGVETIPLENKWQGWYAKLELFRKGLFSGRVVYLDLDTLIVSDITDIATHPHEFSCGTNWKGGRSDVIASAVMAWDGTLDLSHIPAAFSPALIPKYEQSWERWGDQGFIQDHLGRPFQSLLTMFPGRIVHYKTHVRGPTKESPGRVPRGASIVCFSGRPRPHEIQWSLPLAD